MYGSGSYLFHKNESVSAQTSFAYVVLFGEVSFIKETEVSYINRSTTSKIGREGDRKSSVTGRSKSFLTSVDVQGYELDDEIISPRVYA